MAKFKTGDILIRKSGVSSTHCPLIVKLIAFENNVFKYFVMEDDLFADEVGTTQSDIDVLLFDEYFELLKNKHYDKIWRELNV